MKAAIRVVFLLVVCLLTLGQAIRIDRSQLTASPSNDTKPVASNNTTKPKDNKPKAATNSTKPKDNKPKAATNSTKPKENNKPKAASNTTKPKASGAGKNGTSANKTAAARSQLFALPTNSTKSNKTRSANKTSSTNGTSMADAIATGAVIHRIMPLPVSSVAMNTTTGPTDNCPSCQNVRGRPTIDYTKTPSGVSFKSGPIEIRADVEEALVRQVLAVNTGDKVGQSIMAFTKMFVCNSTELVNDVFPANNRFKTVDFTLKGRDAPYMWTISDPSKSNDNNTSAYTYSLTATPKNKAPGLLRPSIIFDQNLLSNENITNTKFDFKLDNFENSYWTLPSGSATHVAVVYTISDVDREGKTHNPAAEHVTPKKSHMNVTVPMTPKVGRDNSGEETLDVTGASVGGIDITGPGFATTANGNQKPVVMTVGKDIDGSTAIYFFYERFNTSLVHDPYVTMNSNILKSSAATVSVMVAVVMTFIAVIMGM